jgi:serine phosphatase RsbU (regulator of sigma subunit)
VTSSLNRCRITVVEVQIAVAKVSKYASAESGDTLEAVERPNGGLSVVLADGQTSGHGAKAISMMVVHQVIGLLAEGVRDGAAARAASDALFTDKKGKVISTLNIASVDLHSSTIVLTRNNPAPVYVARDDKMDCLDAESVPLGTSRDVRPVITEMELETGLTVVIFTDGLMHAGERRGQAMDVREVIHSLLEDQELAPQELADELLGYAVRLDESRPGDDISVLVVKVNPLSGDDVCRMTIRLPLTNLA